MYPMYNAIPCTHMADYIEYTDYETDTLYSNTNGFLLKRAYQLHADDDRVILTYTCKQQNFIHLLYG